MNNQNQKWIRTTLTVSALTAMAALSACGGATNTPASTTSSPEAAGSGNKTVTLSVITSNRFLETAKTNFENQHPNIKIDIKETVAAPKTDPNKQNMIIGGPKDTQNQEKYLSTVATELMSGKASDLLLVDELPYKKYADKKLLENFNELMKNDKGFDRGQYFANLFDAMKYKDAMYAVPVKASFNMLVGNQDLLKGTTIEDSKWTWKDFKAIAEKTIKDDNKDGSPDGAALVNMTESAFVGLLLDSSYTRFVDAGAKKASFTDKSFQELLEMAKAMFDSKLFASKPADRAANLFQAFSPRQYEDMFLLPQTMFSGNSSFYSMPTENEKKGLSFTSDLLLAMNSKSKNKTEAWEFVKYLLSEEMQASRDLQGFAINKKANQKRIDDQLAAGNGSGGNKQQIKLMGKDGKEIIPKAADPKDFAKIEAYLSGIQTYGETDPKVRSIVQEETAAFFSGQKTAEATAKVIQSKVTTYLQE